MPRPGPAALPNGEEGFVRSRFVFKKRFLAHGLSIGKIKKTTPELSEIQKYWCGQYVGSVCDLAHAETKVINVFLQHMSPKQAQLFLGFQIFASLPLDEKTQQTF